MSAGPHPNRRQELAGRLMAGDPSLLEPLKRLRRLRRERWHLWQVLCRVYAGTEARPALATRWAVADSSDPNFDAIAALQDAKAPADRAERRTLTADLELVRADGASDALSRFWAAADQCRLAFIDEMQKAGIQTAADALSKGVYVRQAQSAVSKELGALRGRYEELRDLMRDEAYPEEGPPPTVRLRDLLWRR